MDCKKEILEGLKNVFPEGKWELERVLNADKEKGLSKVVPDISGRMNDKALVVEVQKSTISIDTIIKRTQAYTKWGAHILWIIPLKEELGKDNFRPRLFEKFLHQMYFGRVYYWVIGNGSKVYPVHFSPAYCWIEEQSWYDAEYMEHKEVGGYWKRYRTVRRPDFGSTIDITNTSAFKFDKVPAWKPQNDLMAIPARKIYHDTLNKWWSDLPPHEIKLEKEELEDDYFDNLSKPDYQSKK